ncbi:succinyldiaminopimelate transaminase [Corynebacterium hindlerae]|uniref:succinyldiaminopimelate transaminase n=1 Tax=Corynebacterium hindlerae TaxID=699041 RepID=UPI001AD6EB1B|nr:succinyldiaminopimelate transaminase [Corynebacterium hindlerae]QTH60674.1 succinyldiaminopimelate transaminase [Corynebacterium hindlerae]
MPTRPRDVLGSRLPEFPWDTLSAARERASQHPEGLIDLSIGTPIDDVAPGIQLALVGAAAYPGYPPTEGIAGLREEIASWLDRRYGVSGLGPDHVQPVVGTKEAVALTPLMLGIGAGHTVVIPEVAYPTYEVAALTAGAEAVRADSLTKLGPMTPSLIYLNTPANPTGKVLGLEHLKKVVSWAQERGVIVVSDECYIGLGWDDDNPPVSILDPRVNEGNLTGLLALHSLSKSSNLASYRFGFFAGDPALIAELRLARKHLGLMVPHAVQHAALAALRDDEQEALQKLRYAKRRAKLMRALIDAGCTITDSEAGLYLWATRGEPGRDTVAWLAEYGILVAPGEFYGPKGNDYVRVALTGSDEAIDAACARLG